MAEFDVSPEMNLNIESFDINSEYVQDPLIPDGTFKGIVTKVELKPDTGITEFTIQLQGNEGIFCVDGVTPVDGKTSKYTVWLPVKGDELIKSQFSALTKRQDKIRSIKKFSEKMKINIGTEKDIKQAIESQEWLSIPVIVSIKSRPYEGVLYNQIKKMERAVS